MTWLCFFGSLASPFHFVTLRQLVAADARMITRAVTTLLVLTSFIWLVEEVLSQQQHKTSKSRKSARSGNGSGFVYSDSLLWAFNARSLLSCAKACVEDDLCLAFTFHKGHDDLWKKCRGHSKPGGLLAAKTPHAGVVLYTEKGAKGRLPQPSSSTTISSTRWCCFIHRERGER